MEPIVVEVTRGEVVEARHIVHAVAVRDGRDRARRRRCLARHVPPLVGKADPGAPRGAGAAGPRRRGDRARLRVAPRRTGAARGRPPSSSPMRRPSRTSSSAAGRRPRSSTTAPGSTPASSRCAARATGPRPGTACSEHPCQQAMLREVAEAAEVEPSSLAVGVDGCGVPTFALPLERAAHCFTRLASLDGGERVVRAMRAHPDLLRGPVATDALMIRALDGWVAKGGAEGLFCAASADGLGLALKVRRRRVSRDPARARAHACRARDRPRPAGREPGVEQPRRAGRRAARPLRDLIDDRESDPFQGRMSCIRCAGWWSEPEP